MKNQEKKEYQTPKIEVIRRDDSNKVFFAVSGDGFSSGSLSSMGSTTGEW